MTKTNFIPARPSIPIVNIAGGGEELYPKRLRKAFRPGKDKQDIPATFQAAQFQALSSGATESGHLSGIHFQF